MATPSTTHAPWLPVCAATLVALATACQQAPPNTHDAGLASLRQADSAFAHAVAAEDLEATMAFYADDAALLTANAPTTTGRDAIRKAFIDLFASAGFSLDWALTGADVSKSGDLGYTVGTYQMTVPGPKGQLLSDKGKYVTVWKKQADGSWKVVIDIGNSNLPSAK